MKVLIVEDDANLLASLRRALRRAGWDIASATDATDAMGKLEGVDMVVGAAAWR